MKPMSQKKLTKIGDRQAIAAATRATLPSQRRAALELIRKDVPELCRAVNELTYANEQLRGRVIILETIIEAIIACEDTIGSTFDAERWQHELDVLRPVALSVAPS